MAEHEIFIIESLNTLNSDVVLLLGKDEPLGQCSYCIQAWL